MAIELTPQQIRDELVTALGGIDQSAPLDSLQIVAVMSYLRNRGFTVSAEYMTNGPRTVEGWVTWAGLRSSSS